jgi:translocation and assembly module TamB
LTVRRFFGKALKFTAWTLTGIILLLLLLTLLIQLPPVQTYLTGKAVNFLENKLKTKVRLAGIYLNFPQSIVLKGFYAEDQKKDTLLFADRLSVEMNMWALRDKQIILNQIEASQLTAHLHRTLPDSSFNFDFILKAFSDSVSVAETDTATTPWKITLRTVRLEKIYLTYQDDPLKSDLQVSLGKLKVEMKELDAVRQVYKVKNITLTNSDIAYTDLLEKTDLPTTAKSDTTAKLLTFDISEVNLERVKGYYKSLSAGQTLKVIIGKSQIRADTFDLNRQIIALQKVSFSGSDIRYISQSQPTPKTTISTAQAEVKPWQVSVTELKLDNITLAFDDLNQPRQFKGMDFSHLLLTGIAADAGNLFYRGMDMKGSVKQFAFTEKCGFALKTLQTDFALNAKSIRTGDLLLETANSRLEGNLQFDFNSLENLAKEYPRMRLQTRVIKSRLALQDALFFQPDLLRALPVRLSGKEILSLNAKMQGRVNDLQIEQLQASALQNTRLQLNGSVKNLPDIDRLAFNLPTAVFETSATDLQATLPPALLPASVRLPAKMELTARFSGQTHDFKTNALLRTSSGEVVTQLNLQTNQNFSSGTYKSKLNILQLDLGYLLRQADVGKLTATADLSGNGFDPGQLTAQLNLLVQRLDYKGYAYRNLMGKARAKNQIFSGNLISTDEHINFTLAGGADLSRSVPHYTAELDLKNLELKPLHLNAKEVSVRLKLKTDLRFRNLDSLNGNLDLRKVAVASEGRFYAVDSLLYVSVQDQSRTDIQIDSDILSGRFSGNINLGGIAGALQNHINRYFQLPGDAGKRQSESPQQFDFSFNLRNTALLTEVLVPGLDSLRPGEIKGHFDSRKNLLDFKAEVFKVKYGGLGIDNLLFNVASDKQKMTAILSFDRAKQGDFKVERTSVRTLITDNRILPQLIILDSLQKNKYNIGGELSYREGEYLFSLLPDSLELNYERWQTGEKNNIRFAKTGFFFEDWFIQNNRQRLSLENVNHQPSSVRAVFKDFQLATLGEILSTDTSLITGWLNGKTEVFKQNNNSVFTADLQLDSLRYTGTPVGNLNLQAGQQRPGQIDLSLALTGNKNKVQVKGFYLTAATAASPVNLQVNLERLNLASFASFAKSQVSELSGAVSGNLQVSGKPAQPQAVGSLNFEKVIITPTLLGSRLQIDRQILQLDNQGLHFDSFSITDKDNNTARISGDVLTDNYTFFRLNVDVNARQFQVLNTTAEQNKLYYGNLSVNSRIHIGGTSERPAVQATVRVGKGSNVTYVVPQSEATVAGTEGIVRFRNKLVENDSFIRRLQAKAGKDSTKSSFQGLELTANIEIDSTSTLNVVIDPIAGDKLTVKGETTLSLNMTPAGDMDLTGRYQVQSGTYNLSFYNLIRREFTLNRNSTLTWSGNPLDAALNIQAQYQVVTSPLELVQSRLSGQESLTQFRQRLPFLLLLNVKGVLTKPEVSFKLDMPPEQQNALGGAVYQQIQYLNTQESELNKQVFALFLLQRFIAENPLENSSASLEGSARTSVSKILSDQLNRLASQVQGIELQLDVNSFEDYSGGKSQGRTQLELGVSKNLLNDRLVVKVSGNVDLEGSPTSTQNQQNLSNFLGDLRLEYKLTEDGRLRLLGFRQRDFDIVNGELTRTGAGFIFVRDYNAFRELFRKSVER